jgi:hypothetical protein
MFKASLSRWAAVPALALNLKVGAALCRTDGFHT